MQRVVFVSGQKNAGTDAICSAIAMAGLKNVLAGRQEDAMHLSASYGADIEKDALYQPVYAGNMQPETAYVLERFDTQVPAVLSDARTQVADIDFSRVKPVSGNISLKNAWQMMRDVRKSTLAVTDAAGRLEGVITTNDIAKSYMAASDNLILGVAETPFANIIDTLGGELVEGDPDDILVGGRVMVATANTEIISQMIREGDVLILGNRYEIQLCGIEQKARMIIVCDGARISRTIRKMARENGCAVISTPLDTYGAARLINQSMPVSYFMKRRPICFDINDYIDDIRGTMTNKRFRDFPITDAKGIYKGMISRRNLIDMDKKQMVLVDHNDKKEAIAGIDQAEVMEIVDHHNLGSIETVRPVNMRCQPVGSTSAIICQMYEEQDVPIDEKTAGLLCSGILSATKGLTPELCTPYDSAAAQRLAALAGIDIQGHAEAMAQASEGRM